MTGEPVRYECACGYTADAESFANHWHREPLTDAERELGLAYCAEILERLRARRDRSDSVLDLLRAVA